MMKPQNVRLAGASPSRPTAEHVGAELRRGGAYFLPDGTEVVVGVTGGDGRCFLYHPLVWHGSAWIIEMPVAYEIGVDGAIKSGKGLPTGWRVEDLADTGRTYDPNNRRHDQRIA